jgi:flagellar hook assembly protein FlgD
MELRIYDVSGALVRVLDAGYKPAGVQEVVWDGTNQSGERVATGVYFYRLQTAAFVKSRKMVLLK